MKKSKLTLCLTSGFVAAMSLAACGSAVSSNDNAVVTVKDSNGNVIDISTDAIYDKYKYTSDGVSKFYNAVLEALIRYEYENPNAEIKGWTKAIKSKEKIKQEAEDKVKNDKETADENASTNGTSYDEEWEAILKSHNCLPSDDDDETGAEKLLEYYIYQLEKEDITDKFFTQQKDTLTDEWIGIDQEGKSTYKTAKGVFPYHIRHTLVNIANGSTDFYNTTISEDEAKNLGNTMNALLDSNYTFGEVATRFSGDTTSAEKGGDLGVMATTTSFVNEFKLGIYAFDAIYTHGSANDDDATKNATKVIRDGLGLQEDYEYSLRARGSEADPQPVNTINAFKQIINDGNIQTVPYDAFIQIKKLAESTLTDNGEKVNDGNEHYYPRNVLFNYYLNFHNPFIITREHLKDNGWPEDDTSSIGTGRWTTLFGKEVLCDEKDNVVIGVRSEHGIHFMVMEHSIFQYKEGGEGKAQSSLPEYYTTYVPSDPEFPKYDGKNKDTYVDYITTADASVYTTRANEVKQAIKSFDSTYDYRLFDYISKLEESKVTINNESLKPIRENIEEYISRTRTNNKEDAEKTLNEAWRSYVELIALQYENRTVWTEAGETEDNVIRTIHPRCAIGFKTATGADWEKGGICYAK